MGKLERMAARRFVAGIALAALLAPAGCVLKSGESADFAGSSPDTWARALLARDVDPAAVVNPIAFTPEMRDDADRLAGQGSVSKRLEALQDGLFDASRFPFQYDSRGTFAAIEAYSERRGNCLSFTCLFIAMARSLGLDARAAIPAYEGRSEREGDLVVVNTHVVATYGISDSLLIFDFDRTRERRVVGANMIDDLYLAALYLNNLGVEHLRTGRYDVAIGQFETAIRLSPKLLAARGNLGVARRRAGDTEGALSTYQEALEIEPRDPGILGNLAALYRLQGLEREAEAALTLASVASASPYFLVVRADLERGQGRPDKALKLYRRAHRMDRKFADPLVGIAETELAQGHRRAARSAAYEALAIEPGNAAALRVLERLGEGGAPQP